MRKVIAPAAAVMSLALIASLAFAEMQGGTGPAGMDRPMMSENFGELKADILKRIDERMKKMEEEKACVTAAANMEELRKCRPQRPAGPGGQGKPFPPFGQPR